MQPQLYYDRPPVRERNPGVKRRIAVPRIPNENIALAGRLRTIGGHGA
jgi:hypothetical protein